MKLTTFLARLACGRVGVFALVLLSGCQAFAQVPSYIPASGLRAWYPFNGNANDSSGYAHNGVAYGGITFGPDRFGVAGHSSHNRANGAINIPHHDFPLEDSARSVAVFFKWDSTGPLGVPRLFMSWGSNTLGDRFGLIAKDSSIGVEYVGGYASTFFLMDTQWHSFIVTYASGGTSGLELYLDGAAITTPTVSIPESAFHTDTGLWHNISGSTYYGSAYTDAWHGYVDDVAVWGRALTPCEVWQVAHSSLDSAGIGSITGADTICIGTPATLSADSAGGTWTSSATSRATVDASSGVVTGVSPGIDTIIYRYSVSCGTARATHVITVERTPTAGSITGADSICGGAVTTFTASGGTTGGTWASGAGGLTSVDSAGHVTALSAGTDTITYTITNSCGSATSLRAILVRALPDSGFIFGDTTVCAGSSTTLTETALGGAWSCSSSAIATVDSTGNVNGVGTGRATISYTVTNSCRTSVATFGISVLASPDAGVISGSNLVCAGSTLLLSDSSAGGIWSSSDTTVARVSSSGLVTGVSAGSVAISYSVSVICGTESTDLPVTVFPLPIAVAISGSPEICIGATVSLSDTSTGGSWVAANGNATCSSGSVTGVHAGMDTVYYIASNRCGADTAFHALTIDTTADAGVITAADTSVCPNDTVTLADGVAGGTWVSGNPAIATVNSTSGLAIGVGTGSDEIFYIISNACGPDTASRSITVLSETDCNAGVHSPSVRALPGISISPNPNNGSFFALVTAPAKENYTILVTNMLGQRIASFEGTANQDLAVALSLPAGVYLVTANMNGIQLTTRIVVE